MPAYKAGKLRVDLIPTDALLLMADVFGNGAEKYGDRDWETAKPAVTQTKLYGAIQRHLYKWMDGEDLDDESGLPHLSHAAASCVMLLSMMKRGLRDDRPTTSPLAQG